MSEEKIFAPCNINQSDKVDWLCINVGMKADEMIAFINAHRKPDGWVNTTIKKSQKGKMFMELNTWVKDANYKAPTEQPQQETQSEDFNPNFESPIDDTDDIPF